MLTKVVLVVDDEASVRAYVKSVLHEAGYHPIEADNGAQALQLLRDCGGVDLLVSDINMPVMDGLTLARFVTNEFPALPFLLISGLGGDATSEGAPFELLTKPFLPSALLGAVKKVIALKARTA